jgi:hypothetical protein
MNLCGSEIEMEVAAHVKNTSILKVWGNSSDPQTRKENGNIPLVFDCDVKLIGKDVTNATTGEGLAEYIRHARL